MILRLALAAAIVAVIGLVAYNFIGRDEAREAPVEPMSELVDPSPESVRDARKKARAAAKLAVQEGCPELRADYEVWDDYLDKKARRKLKALVEKCDKEAEAQASAEPGVP
jgi:hypothetical protein